MTAIVLTVSDSASRGEREDRSGPAVRQRLEELGYQVSLDVVSDDAALISQRLLVYADHDRVDAVFTTGGTGVAARDVTPEATRAVMERELPGLGELMRREGLHATPTAVLSRAVAGTRHRTLIVNLPGSPKGALESLNAVVHLVPHVHDLLQGRTEHAPAPKPDPEG